VLDDPFVRHGCARLEQADPAVAHHVSPSWAVITMAFDMPARQSFVIEMTSREDLMNRHLAQQFSFQLRPHRRSVIAGCSWRKVGIPACFLIDGLSFFAVIAGLLLMRLPKKETHIDSDAGPLGQAWKDSATFGDTGASSPFPFPLRCRRNFRMVVTPCSCRRSARCSAPGRERLRHINGGQCVGRLPPLSPWPAPGIFCRRGSWRSAASAFSPRRSHSSPSTGICMSRFCLLALVGFGIVLYFSTSNTVLQSIVPDECGDASWESGTLIFGGMIPWGSLQGRTHAISSARPQRLRSRPHLCCRRARHAQHKRRREAQLAAAR